MKPKPNPYQISKVKPAGAVEYTACISAKECPVYDIKQSDGEAPVMLELWRMRSAPLLLLFPGPSWPGVVVPGRVLFLDQINRVLTLK